jgi:hypothetical protein
LRKVKAKVIAEACSVVRHGFEFVSAANVIPFDVLTNILLDFLGLWCDFCFSVWLFLIIETVCGSAG